MVAKYVKTYICPKCGRLYSEKHYEGLNNVLPKIPQDLKCTYINNFPDRHRLGFNIEVCGCKLELYDEHFLVPSHRSYYEKDECLEYYIQSSMKELIN